MAKLYILCQLLIHAKIADVTVLDYKALKLYINNIILDRSKFLNI